MPVTGVNKLPRRYLIVIQTLLPLTKKSILANAFFEEVREERASTVIFFSQLFFLFEEESYFFEVEPYLVMQAEKPVEFLGWVSHAHPFLRTLYYFLFSDAHCPCA